MLRVLALVSLSSRIKPLLEMRLEALEHLFFDVFDVSKLAAMSHVRALNLYDKLLNQPSLFIFSNVGHRLRNGVQVSRLVLADAERTICQPAELARLQGEGATLLEALRGHRTYSNWRTKRPAF